MQVWRELSDVPADFGPSVVTIGNFDGVHRGHASVLRRMCADAATAGAQAVAVTFSPHPQQVHRPDTAPPLLTGDADRLELLEQTGLDAVLLLEYTLEFARQTPEEFVRRYLVDVLHARTVVVGRDVRFGVEQLRRPVDHGRARPRARVRRRGHRRRDPRRVRRPGQRRGPRGGPAAPTLVLDVGARAARRRRRRPGRARARPAAPGARHRRARRRARPRPGLPDGQPRTRRDRHGARRRRVRRLAASRARARRDAAARTPVLPAAISIGTNPTFDGVERRVEAYVLDRTDLDLYDEVVVLELVERLRPTLRFDSVDDLVVQMHEDVDRAREVLDAPELAGRCRSDRRRLIVYGAPYERPRTERARVDMPRRTAQRDNLENRAARKCRQAVHHDRVRHPRG